MVTTSASAMGSPLSSILSEHLLSREHHAVLKLLQQIHLLLELAARVVVFLDARVVSFRVRHRRARKTRPRRGRPVHRRRRASRPNARRVPKRPTIRGRRASAGRRGVTTPRSRSRRCARSRNARRLARRARRGRADRRESGRHLRVRRSASGARNGTALAIKMFWDAQRATRAHL